MRRAPAPIAALLTLLVARPALVAGAPAAPGEGLRPAPLVEIEAALRDQRAVADFGATRAEDTRGLWRARVAVGVDLRLPERLLPVGRLRAQAALGYGFVFGTADSELTLGGAILWEAALARRFALFPGLSLRAVVDTTAAARSSMEIGLPLGVRVAMMEIVYQPSLILPLGSEARPLLGGERRVGARLGIAPLSLVLRFAP